MPSDELGFDFSCVQDLDPRLGQVSGQSALIEAIARRWLTTPGTLFYDRQYGGGLLAMLNASYPTENRLQYLLERQALEDERVQDAEVSVSFKEATGVLTIQGRITAADGPFDLTLSVDEYGQLIGSAGEYTADAPAVTQTPGGSGVATVYGSDLLFEHFGGLADLDASGRVVTWPNLTGALPNALVQTDSAGRPLWVSAGGPGGLGYLAFDGETCRLASQGLWGERSGGALMVVAVMRFVGEVSAGRYGIGLANQAGDSMWQVTGEGSVAQVEGTAGGATGVVGCAADSWSLASRKSGRKMGRVRPLLKIPTHPMGDWNYPKSQGKSWRTMQDSNLRPLAPEANALSS